MNQDSDEIMIDEEKDAEVPVIAEQSKILVNGNKSKKKNRKKRRIQLRLVKSGRLPTILKRI